MNDRRIFMDMKPRTGPDALAVSRDVLEMSDHLAQQQEAEREREADAARRLAFAEEQAEEIRSRISPPGTLGLPPLLDARRMEYALTDAVFQQQAMFDKLFVAQVDVDKSETADPRGKIIAPPKARERQIEAYPRGIIVSAGLLALDQLETNGSGLGHIVTFCRLTPWRIPFEMISGKERYLIPLNTSDILADSDAWTHLRAGKIARARTPSGRNAFVVNDEVVEPVEVEQKEIGE